MQESDAINLIKKGIKNNHPQNWADLGCGEGTFTLALASLLPQSSTIFAYDLKSQHLPGQYNNVPIHFERLDFVKAQIPTTGLDGILMANSLHYVKDKTALIDRLQSPAFIIVEYESRIPNPWVPFPIPSAKLMTLFSSLHYKTALLATYPSRFGGQMYSLLASK